MKSLESQMMRIVPVDHERFALEVVNGNTTQMIIFETKGEAQAELDRRRRERDKARPCTPTSSSDQNTWRPKRN